MREYEKLIDEAQARRVGLMEKVRLARDELAFVRAALADRPKALAKAKDEHNAALAKLNALPSNIARPEPWQELFALLARGPVTISGGLGSGEVLIDRIRTLDQARTKRSGRGPWRR